MIKCLFGFFSVQLTTEHSMHVICVKGKGYAVSGEVSAFIWERDLLRTMVSWIMYYFKEK